MEAPQPRAYSVADFAHWSERGELVLDPAFQRRSIWKPVARSFLIDTIVRGFPVPIIFIRQKLNIKTRTTVREVVDGQQRIRAILDFLGDRLSVQKIHNAEIAGVTFSNLPEEVQAKVLSYQFSVVVLEGATDADVLDVFSRLNTYQERLNRQELLNAEFTGAFKNFVYGLGREHLEFWRTNRILSNRQILRMGEAQLVSELVVAMLDGLQDKKKSLKHFYTEFESSFPEADEIRARFQKTIDVMSDLFADLLPSTPFRKRVIFYSLFLVVFDALFGLRRSPTNPQGARYQIPMAARGRILGRLSRLGDELDSRDPQPEYVPFWEAAHRQTDNLSPRQTRHRFIWQAFEPDLVLASDS